MSAPWEQARQRIEEARPDWAPIELRHLGRGWDCDVYLVNAQWAVRFPLTPEASRVQELELLLLPWLAAQLPIPIPAPVRLSASGLAFGAHRFLPGRTLVEARLDTGQRARLAPTMGRVMAALHQVPISASPTDLPRDQLRRLDANERVPRTLELLASLPLEAALTHRLTRIAEVPPPHPPSEPLVIVHADAHPGNWLVDDGGITGLIDWVDVHEGHRALDLAVLYEVLPPNGREAFLREYGSVDPLLLQWARWRALDHTTRGLAGALERGLDHFASACHQALTEIAVD